MDKSAKEILIEARKLIEKPEHWIQGDYQNGEGGYCAYGALGAAEMHAGFDCGEAADILSEAMGGGSTVCIEEFNDAPQRTHAEILAAFDRAIEAAP